MTDTRSLQVRAADNLHEARTVHMQAKTGEVLAAFIERAIKVSIAAGQPIEASHGTLVFIVHPSHAAQTMHHVATLRDWLVEKSSS